VLGDARIWFFALVFVIGLFASWASATRGAPLIVRGQG
jgi:hypothetical protein